MSNIGPSKLLYSSTLSSDQTTVDISSIPQIYKHLHLYMNIKGSASSDTSLRMRLNSDSGTNYNYQYFGVTAGGYQAYTGSPTSLSSLGLDIPYVADSRSASTYFSSAFLQIHNYSQSSLAKPYMGNLSTPVSSSFNTRTMLMFGQNQTLFNPITSISLFLSTGSFKSGSDFYLFGVS